MIKLKKTAFLSPLGIFFLYILASALVIMGFRLVFPGEAVPLAHFSVSWRLIRGLLDYLSLFPALVLSSLVIPFAFTIRGREKINPFSPRFLQSLKMSIVSAIVASALYGFLFFLALPLARDYEANLRYQGRLYGFAKENAREHAARGEWNETAGFIAICERIWPGSPEMARLKTDTEILLEQELLAPDTVSGAAAVSSLPGFQPVDVTEALELAEKALAEERYFDAHWLATLGGRLAKDDSVETARAAQIAGRAWNGVSSLEPNAAEARAREIFRLKRDGHTALLAGEWIRAYYLFLELFERSPDDPDAAEYLALSRDGLKKAAFFTDEIEPSLEKILTGAIFSLPYGSGRLVMRLASLLSSADSAYGIGADILAFDREGRPLWSMEAQYAKILPLVLESGGETPPAPRPGVGTAAPAALPGEGVTVLMRALDREDQTKNWEPLVQGFGEEAPKDAQIALALSWDDFLLLSRVRRGLSALSVPDLAAAPEHLGNYGYQGEVFEAELLRRFAETLFLLPLGIFAIVIGWQYRALKRPRYMAIPMLGILPLVFNGLIYFCRIWVNRLGIWAVVSLGFTSAAMVFGAAILVLFILSLIVLAAQHG